MLVCMSSAQVPIWVPIVVAILGGLLGAIGVVVGQVVNNKSQNRRLYLQELQENRKTMRADKMRIFAGFLEVFHELAELLHVFMNELMTDQKPSSVEVLDRMDGLIVRLAQPIAHVNLVASGDLLNDIDAAFRLFRDALADIRAGESKVFRFKGTPEGDVPLTIYYEILDMLRAELSIEPVTDS